MRRITVRLTDAEYDFLLSLVREGMYMNVSDAVRDIIRQSMRRR